MSKSRGYLFGQCTLQSRSERLEHVRCYLDLEECKFVCEVEHLHGFAAISPASLDEIYTVTDIELWGPGTRLNAAYLPVSFIGSISGGTLSVQQTPLRHILGINAQVGLVSFVISNPIHFSLEEESNEVLLKPGLDTVGLVELDNGLRISGTKETISLLGGLILTRKT